MSEVHMKAESVNIVCIETHSICLTVGKLHFQTYAMDLCFDIIW